MGGIYTGGDVVLLMLPLVVFYHQPCRTQGGEVRHDGRADGYRQILDASFNFIPVFISCFSFLSFPGLGKVLPSIPDSKFPIQLEILNSKFLILNSFLFSPVRKIFFSYWESDFLRAFQSHDKGTTSAGGNHTIQYVAVRLHMLFSSPGFLAVRSDEAQ